jgi:hypothetical protein
MKENQYGSIQSETEITLNHKVQNSCQQVESIPSYLLFALFNGIISVFVLNIVQILYFSFGPGGMLGLWILLTFVSVVMCFFLPFSYFTEICIQRIAKN